MGKKRKHRDTDSSERLLRRVKKLEEKLRKRRRKSRSRSSSPSSRSGSESPKRISYYNEDEPYSSDKEPTPSLHTEDNDVNHSAAGMSSIFGDSTQQPSTSAKPPEGEDKSTSENTEMNRLDEDILTILGDAPKDESPVGKDIHKDISARLQDVLQNGLKKEVKEKITEDYPIPGNCPLFKAPILNDEVKAAVSDILQKKDASLSARQGQIGIALTALTTAMDILVAEKSEMNQTLLKHISNAARLLCDSHYIDTRMRRNFLISTLNNKLKDTLKEAKRDKYLFGEVLPDKLKANKAITRCSQDLRSFKPKSVVTKNSAPSGSQNNLNWKHPQSNTQNVNRKPSATSHPRSAGHTMGPRKNESARKAASSRVSKNNAHYKHQRRT